MNRYLLLRDNKQSGPYTAPELIEKGIKPYDLVWLDGRSAAWRYPSEIEELKAYAPVVEEQPFDRFYKKPVAAVASSSGAQSVNSSAGSSSLQPGNSISIAQQEIAASPVPDIRSVVENRSAQTMSSGFQYQPSPPSVGTGTSDIHSRSVSIPDSVNRPAVEPESRTVAPRKIYVTLPGKDKPQTATPQSSRQAAPGNDISAYMPRPAAPLPASTPVPVREGNYTQPETEVGSPDNAYPADKLNSFIGPIASNAVPSHPKYVSVESRDNSFSAKLSVDDPYTDKPYTDKVPPTSKIPVIPVGRFNWAITAIGAVCLLLGGVIIGLVISNRNQTAKAELVQLVNQIREREKAKAAEDSPAPAVTETVAAEVSDNNAAVLIPSETAAPQQQTPDNGTRSAKSLPKAGNNIVLTGADKQQANQPVIAIATEEKPTPVQPAVIREERVANTVAAETARKNIRQLVSVVNNKYKTGVLGGISELELTVANKSDFELDQVEVEVEYLGPEKRVVKKQIIVFSNVKPGRNVTQEVPRTNRGVTVNTTIRSINSKSLGLASAGL